MSTVIIDSVLSKDMVDTPLTGLSTATAAPVTATDTVLAAVGKLQGQINTNTTAITNKVDLVQLTKAQYDALSTTDKNLANKLYVLVG